MYTEGDGATQTQGNGATQTIGDDDDATQQHTQGDGHGAT
jgi:hypothetical protein